MLTRADRINVRVAHLFLFNTWPIRARTTGIDAIRRRRRFVPLARFDTSCRQVDAHDSHRVHFAGMLTRHNNTFSHTKE